MNTAWLRTILLFTAVATAGFGFALQAAEPCADCDARLQQCIIDNQNNWPGPQLDCATMHRMCQRGQHCPT